MPRAEIVRAWRQWADFADPLPLSDDDPAGTSAFHGRVFRVCGRHPPRARQLRNLREALRKSLAGWMDDKPTGNALTTLGSTIRACLPAWGALFGLDSEKVSYWDDLQREATVLGVDVGEEPLWRSPFFSEGKFDPLTALRGEPRESALPTLEALWQVAAHAKGERLWNWLQKWQRLASATGVFGTAYVFEAAITNEVLTAANVKLLRLDALIPKLNEVCEDFLLRCLNRLNESVPLPTKPVAQAGAKVVRAVRTVYRREVPDPLPIEPYFRKIRGSEAFLHAIAEEPLEDAHRLAFADWLDEAGHTARAEFIRQQCAQARLPAFHPLHGYYEAKNAELLEANAVAWLKGFDQEEGSPVGPESFHRGMIEHVGLKNVVVSPAVLKSVFAIADIRKANINCESRETLAELLAYPGLSRLTSLEMCFPRWGVEAADLDVFATTPALRGLTYLGLGGGLREADLPHLLERLDFPALTSLSIFLRERGAAALAGCAWLANIRELTLLRAWRVDTAALVRTIASSQHVSNLRSLTLETTGLTNDGVEALANSPFLSNLTTLGLSCDRVRNGGIRALMRSRFLTRLTALDLSLNDLKPEGIRLLTQADAFRRLEVLNLSNNRLDDAALTQLTAAPESPALTALSLSLNSLTDSLATALAGSALVKHLTSLSLAGTELTDQGAIALAESPGLANVAHLDVRVNQLERKGIEAIKKRWPEALV